MLTKPPAISWWESNSASLQQTQSGSKFKLRSCPTTHIERRLPMIEFGLIVYEYGENVTWPWSRTQTYETAY